MHLISGIFKVPHILEAVAVARPRKLEQGGTRLTLCVVDIGLVFG